MYVYTGIYIFRSDFIFLFLSAVQAGDELFLLELVDINMTGLTAGTTVLVSFLSEMDHNTGFVYTS